MNKHQKELYANLTRLQKNVCLGLLSGKVYSEAYYDAGGLAKRIEDANSIVSRMLSSDVNVKAFMDEMEGEAISDAVMTKREALERLSSIAGTSISDLVNFASAVVKDDEGNEQHQSTWSLKSEEAIDPIAMAAISELTAGRDGFKFKLHSSVGAIKELSAMLGWNSPVKAELTGKDGGPLEVVEKSDREIARRIAIALAKGVEGVE